MKKIKPLILLFVLFFVAQASADKSIQVAGELKALKTDSFTPPRVKGIWQYTISFMAEDGSVVKEGMPVLMFKRMPSKPNWSMQTEN